MKGYIIYRIYCISTRREYIGSTKHYSKRVYEHQWELTNNRHSNKRLQHAWNKYGRENFVFEPLDCAADEAALLILEQHYIDTRCAVKRGYNICPRAGTYEGVKQKASTNLKRSLSMKGRTVSFETREKQRQAKLGISRTTEEKLKISRAMKGIPKTRKHAHNIALAKMGGTRSLESRRKQSETRKARKIRAWNRGRPLSTEHKARIGKALIEFHAKLP